VRFHDILHKVFRDILYTPAVAAGETKRPLREVKDALEDGEGGGTEDGVCDSSEQERKELPGVV
ncbi:MAG TPA: hypothetical protein VGK21_10450, partial [Candidatus Angelobacter sp.]